MTPEQRKRLLAALIKDRTEEQPMTDLSPAQKALAAFNELRGDTTATTQENN
jgi:hypothetical protein